MARFSGVVLVLTGVGLAGYTVLPPPSNDARVLAEVTRISLAPDREPSADGRIRTFSPTSPLWSGAAAAVIRAPSVSEVAPDSAGPWTTVVKAEPVPTSAMTSPKPGDAETRAILVRDLQAELKRVGCYGGEVNGAWTQSTRRAMSIFMDRVNATLPVEEPDYILLTLVQGHRNAACGAGCPKGQSLANDGRCVPAAVLAQASRKAQKEQKEQERRVAEAAREEQQKIAREQAAAEKRHAEAVRQLAAAERGTVTDDAKARREQRRLAEAARAAEAKRMMQAREDERRATRWKAEALASAAGAAVPEELPWLKSIETAPVAVAAAPERPAPLPGRMAIGGPVPVAAALPSASGNLRIAAAEEAVETNSEARVTGTSPGAAAEATATETSTIEPAPAPKAKARTARRKTANAQRVARPRPYYYASSASVKARRGYPRPGTIRYMIYSSMGGVY